MTIINGVEIIGREEVGLRSPQAAGGNWGDVDVITAHWWGGDLAYGSLRDLCNVLKNVQANDMVSKGYSDIMYSFSPNPFDSRPIELRGIGKKGAANGSDSANRRSPSVVHPWGPNMTYVSRIPNWEANILASCQAIDAIAEMAFNKDLPWVGHHVWRPTACAGPWVEAHLAAYNVRKPAVPEIPAWWMPDPDYSQRPWIGQGSYAGHNLLAWDGFLDYGYVRWLQMFLNYTSPNGCPVDGTWGPITQLRVNEFQTYFGIPRIPCVDTRTWSVIHWVATQQGIV